VADGASPGQPTAVGRAHRGSEWQERSNKVDFVRLLREISASPGTRRQLQREPILFFQGRLTSIVVTAIAILLTCASSAAATATRIRVGTVPKLPVGAKVSGTTPAELELHLTVALAPSDPAELEAFATAVSTPGSPSFHQYLDVPQFVQRFSPTPAQIGAVQTALRGAGLEVGEPTANHLTLPVSGSAAEVESAFRLSLSQVQLAGGRSAHLNQQAPSLPSAVAPYVQGVIGLDNLASYEPQRGSDEFAPAEAATGSATPAPQVVTGGPQPCAEAQAIKRFGGHTADEIASTYQLSSLYGAGNLGAGQTIALVEYEPYQPSDIATYQACYGTNVPVTPVNVDGGPGPYLGHDGEAALDIEQVIGLAPAASVLVYQAPNRFGAGVDVLSAMTSENRAKVISVSWGLCEQFSSRSAVEAENTLLQEAAAQGQSFFASSGDSGSEGCTRANPKETSLSAENPASQPFATGVGGTSLQPTGPAPETLWNNGYEAATGGGVSRWTMPTYQSGAAAPLQVIGPYSALCSGSTYCREVPDVAANADEDTGYIVYAENHWVQVGGTSAAAPLWAALTALVNATPACRGRTIGFANPALYAIAGSAYAANFRDIVARSPFGYGTNDEFGEEGPYPVNTGYDMTTGLGSPILPALAASLCAIASPVYTVSVANPGNLRSTTKRPVAVQMTAADSGGIGVTYAAAGLPAGLAINPATGAISGVPTKLGISTVTVSATDGYTNTGAVQFRWKITRLKTVRVTKVKLRGVGAGRPKLSFIATVGKSSPRLQALKVKLPRGLLFNGARRSLAQGVTIVGKHGKRLTAHLRVRHGALQVKLAKPAQKLKVTARWPALVADARLSKQVSGHNKKLKLVIGATDAAHHGARFAISTRAR
jgi:subtilase family serine protease